MFITNKDWYPIDKLKILYARGYTQNNIASRIDNIF